MAQDILKSTTTFPLVFQLIASSDHIAGLTGKAGSVVVKISKAGASGVSPSGAISEVDSTNLPGVYAIAGNATDSNTAGPLWIYAKDAASDPTACLLANVIDPTVANYGVNVVNIGGTAQTGRDIGTSVLLSNGTGTGQVKLASGYVAITWADIAAPTTPLNLSGTTIATTQKVDVDTIKTNPVINGGTITFPTTATLASTTNITAGTITTATNVTNAVTVGTVNASASNIKKNTALAGYPFVMTDSTTHAPKTGLTVTGTVSLDGGSFGSLTNSITELANGWYKVSLAAADLNGNTVALRFTATAADDRDITIITQA